MHIAVGNLWLNKLRSVLSAAEESKRQHCNQTKSYSEQFLQPAVVERRTYPTITFKEGTKPARTLTSGLVYEVCSYAYGALSGLADFPFCGQAVGFVFIGVGERVDLIRVKIGVSG